MTILLVTALVIGCVAMVFLAIPWIALLFIDQYDRYWDWVERILERRNK